VSFHVLRGNALHLPLADESVQCVVTSPPYFGLRDYGISGQLGLEPTPEEYVANMVAVFREVWRVLRPDGTVWLNLGDSYAGSGRGLMGDGTPSDRGTAKQGTNRGTTVGQYAQVNSGLKPKDLCGIPWRVAFALQADGWWLRSDIIWSKPNPMPESVTDRPTKAHEYVFLLTKAARYYYDAEAVKEEAAYGGYKDARAFDGKHAEDCEDPRWDGRGAATRNRRTVWTITPTPYSGAHFATMPPKLAETCIKAGTSERGCCPACGAPWERVVEKGEPQRVGGNAGVSVSHADGPMNRNGNGQWDEGHMPMVRQSTTIGWEPTCGCDAGEPVPCIVLDPFGGAGTTLMVADRLNRRGVGVELSAAYARMAYGRCYRDAPLLAFAEVTA
jgi:DNA modification methylase